MSLSESRADWIVRETRKRQPADRSTFLDGACAGDEALRKRLEAILAEPHGFASSITEQTELAPLGPSNDFHSRSDEAVGQTIGRYKVLQKIGEGGCGAVYMAEQEQPVRRRVALKVIKLGMDTKAVIARFEAERQALALMDHPNIARVLDAGTTETGRPYFVMELVRGIKFTEYCDQNHLGVDKRLELFTQICQAIQHAHQKGIIHRDIKPSNILVTLHDGVPVPKVIDFGIAKATTDQRLTDKTLFTAYEQFIGTPAYMSPEQAEMSGLDIDTRSDIYSLGVLLYELLTGRTPFDPKELMDSGLDAMRKTIREKDPMRPSTKLHTLMGEELTTTARRHGVEGPKLVSQLRGDLDWIVMKCLEKDRTRRYETANGLAMDIKRHVSNQPVTARPPSKLYEFQKTFRRHKVGFIATGSVILALAIGVALTTWQAMLATHAKGQEAIQRRKAQDNEQLAMESSAKEASLRRKAEAQELAARQRAYASDMNIAALALQGNLEGSCLGMAFANDGRTLATSTIFRSGAGRSSSGGSITLWRVPEGTKLFSFPTTPSGTDPGILFACTADLSVAAYSEDRGRIHVVDLHNGKELWTAVASKEYVTTLAFSPDGQTLASGSGFAESDIRLWRVATGEPTGQLAGHNSWVSSIVFWPDGKRLATSSADQTIRIWDIAKKECVDVLRGHRQEVWRLALLPDNKTLISGSKDGVVCFWDTALSHVHQSHITLPERVVTWAMTPGSQSIVALNQEGQVSRWTGPDFQHNTRLVKAGRAYVERNGELFSEDGRTLAVGSTNGTMQVWDLERCDLKRQWTEGVGEVRPGAFVEGGSKLVTTTMVDGLHHEREVSSGQQIQSWRWPTDFIGLSVSPDDRYCLAYGYGGNYVLRTLPDKSDRMLPLDCVEGAAASFSTDGSLFVIASDMGYARVWNTSTWREVTTLGGVLLGMNSGQFSTDGKRLVIASSGVEAAKLFDTESWQEVFTLAGLGYGAMGAKFSPDGNSVLWGNITGDLYIWRAPSWDEIRAAEARENSEAPGNSKGM
jgi:eukaryotic-like serine/threonine-protein kinase